MADVGELGRHGLLSLHRAFCRQRALDRGGINGLDLGDEALVDSEDVVRVIASQSKELEYVRDSDRCGIGVESEGD
eukprot:scaffold263529_cov31-Tisochrysis_lutea.AAC.2